MRIKELNILEGGMEIEDAPQATQNGAGEHEGALDLTGLRCPLPVIKLKRHLKKIGSENISILRVKTTDPDSVADFAELSRILGVDVCYVEDSGIYLFTFRFVS